MPIFLIERAGRQDIPTDPWEAALSVVRELMPSPENIICIDYITGLDNRACRKAQKLRTAVWRD
jgi:hypothetical protein